MPYKDKDKQREFQRLRVAKIRNEWLLENGPCIKCQSSDSLEVDHIDRNQKVSHRIWSWSKDRREMELAKCQVLCHKCHWEKTKLDLGHGTINHGTLTAYNVYACRCVPCKIIKSKKNKKDRTNRQIIAEVAQLAVQSLCKR